jgi:hypothetical protein
LLEVTSNAAPKLSGGTIGVGAVVETLTGGTVSVSGEVHNSDALFAKGSNSVVLIASGAVVTGGVAEIGNAIVSIAASSSENVVFLANGSGGLVLNGLGNAYTGRLSGFGFGSSARPSVGRHSWRTPYAMTCDLRQGRQSSVETLGQRQILMAERIAVDAADHLEAKLPVEAWRLEAVRLEYDLSAISRLRFRLDGAHQARALALPAQAFGHEEIADIAGAAPDPAIEAAGARAVVPTQEDADETPVGYAGRLEIEINEAVFEEADVLDAGFGLHD